VRTYLLRDRHSARWRILILLLLVIVSSCRPAGTDHHDAATQNQAATPEQAAIKLHHGVGVIKKINPQDPSIMIDHEEIKDYMGAMTMEYYVKDKSLLDSIQPGDKVDFTIEDKQGVVVVSEIKKK
jgi:Cu/Ag efflux protein CusF